LQITFEGKVFSGKGEGKRFVELPWVQCQVEEKLGFTPFFGTLNLRLNKESAAKKKLLVNGLKVEPQRGFCPGMLFKACIGGLECAVVLPQVPDYPLDVLEVIAPTYLRGQLGLADGNMMAVAVNV
jgi:riboflavin kinase